MYGAAHKLSPTVFIDQPCGPMRASAPTQTKLPTCVIVVIFTLFLTLPFKTATLLAELSGVLRLISRFRERRIRTFFSTESDYGCLLRTRTHIPHISRRGRCLHRPVGYNAGTVWKNGHACTVGSRADVGIGPYENSSFQCVRFSCCIFQAIDICFPLCYNAP